MSQFHFQAIGTTWKIDIYKELDEYQESKLFAAIKNRVERFENHYSRFREDSIITQISLSSETPDGEMTGLISSEERTQPGLDKNNRTRIFLLPDDAEKMLLLYYELYKRTNGFFTPLVGGLLSDT
ncbi:MAG: hypothetical protein WCK88_07380 [bacterium]